MLKMIFTKRENIIKKSCKKAFKVIVDTKRSKNEICKYYNCPEEKVSIQPFSPLIIKKEFINNDNINQINPEIKNLKNYLFYPAHFWAHKNHKYIIDAVNDLKINFSLKVNIVFCGNDKGNLKYIKETINKLNLDDQFIIFNYVKNEELIYLYRHCKALVVPSYIATSTLPLYEAFYFKVPVLYSMGILDPELEKFVNTFNLKNYNDLTLMLKKICENKFDYSSKVKDAHQYLEKFCNSKNLSENLYKIINEYQFVKSIWDKG